MAEIWIGSWIVDLEEGFATEGDLRITVVPEGDQVYALRYSGNVPSERREAVAAEAVAVWERAKVLVDIRRGEYPFSGCEGAARTLSSKMP